MSNTLFVVTFKVNAYEDAGPFFVGMFTSEEKALEAIPSNHFGRVNRQHSWYELEELEVDVFHKPPSQF